MMLTVKESDFWTSTMVAMLLGEEVPAMPYIGATIVQLQGVLPGTPTEFMIHTWVAHRSAFRSRFIEQGFRILVHYPHMHGSSFRARFLE